MPYLRTDRPGEGYRIRLRLGPPWDQTLGPLQTGTKKRQTAERMESWLRETIRERPEIVDALLAKDLTFREVWQAKLRRGRTKDHLQELLDRRKEPLLAAAVSELAEKISDQRTRTGLRQLPELASAVEVERSGRHNLRSPEIRVSWICDPGNIEAVYDRALAEGRQPNSVRRSIHRAVAELLLKHRGAAKRNEIFQDLKIPANNDMRKVLLDEHELQAILNACDPDFKDFVSLAVLLGVDRKPLLRLTPRHFGSESGTLQVPDRKTTTRLRTLQVSDPAYEILARRCVNLTPDTPIFPWTPDQTRHLWDATRDRAAGNPSRNQQERGMTNEGLRLAREKYEEEQVVTLPILRFKDLRHLVPTFWNALGLPPRDLEEIMGWSSGSKMSARYTYARIHGDRSSLNAIAGKLGFPTSPDRAK